MGDISVSTAAASFRLVELDTVKAHLSISGSAKDVELGELIDYVSEQLAGPRGINRPPWRQEYVERLPGEGGTELRLSRWPIQSTPAGVVTKGTGDTPDTVDATLYSVAGEDRDYLYRAGGWEDSAWDPPDGRSQGRRARVYTVTYWAGWKMPDEAVSGDEFKLPLDVPRAALAAVVYLHRQAPPGIRAESKADHRIDYGAGGGAALWGEVPAACFTAVQRLAA